MRTALQVLQQEIDARTGAIVAGQESGWPCRKGCGLCCTRLASIPLLTGPEWDQLLRGLEALPVRTREEIAARIASLSAGPVVCPLLDRNSQSCLVYDHRPIACRTYGFYVERDQGLYCSEILAMVESGVARDVVWGNAASVDAKLDLLGERHELTVWFCRKMDNT